MRAGKSWVAIAAVWIGLGSAADAAGTVSLGRLRGEVRDSAKGERVAGATLLAATGETAVLGITATDPKGFLALDGLPAGAYRVIAMAGGFMAGEVKAVAVGGPFRAVVEVPLKRGVERPAELVLGPGTGDATKLSVQISDEEGRPLPGVLVRCEPVTHRADPTEGRTQQDGRLELGPLEAGGWKLTLARAGWTRLVVPSVRWPAGELRVIARLLPSGDSKAPVGELLPPGELQ